MTSEKQESGDRPRNAQSDGGEEKAGSAAFEQASEAMHGLRSVIDQASQTLRDLTQAGEDWAKGAEDRAREMAKELRGQGERAVGTVSQQVERNPLTSLAVAFALGFVCAALIRR